MNESIFVLNYGFENSSKGHVFHVSNNFSLSNDFDIPGLVFDFRASLRDQQVHSLTTQINESNTIISCKIAN